MRPAEKTVTVRGNHGSEQSRVYPHRLQITLHRSSTVGAPQTSQGSPTPGRASSGALRTVSAMGESTAPGSLNPFSMVPGGEPEAHAARSEDRRARHSRESFKPETVLAGSGRPCGGTRGGPTSIR